MCWISPRNTSSLDLLQSFVISFDVLHPEISFQLLPITFLVFLFLNSSHLTGTSFTQLSCPICVTSFNHPPLSSGILLLIPFISSFSLSSFFFCISFTSTISHIQYLQYHIQWKMLVSLCPALALLHSLPIFHYYTTLYFIQNHLTFYQSLWKRISFVASKNNTPHHHHNRALSIQFLHWFLFSENSLSQPIRSLKTSYKLQLQSPLAHLYMMLFFCVSLNFLCTHTKSSSTPLSHSFIHSPPITTHTHTP